MCLCASIYTLVNYLCEKVAYCTHPIHLAEFHRLASHKLGEGKGEERGWEKELKGTVGREKYDNIKTKTEKLKQQIGKLMGGGGNYITAKSCTLMALFLALHARIAAGSYWTCHDSITHLLYSHPKFQQLSSPYLVILLPHMFCYSLSINASLRWAVEQGNIDTSAISIVVSAPCKIKTAYNQSLHSLSSLQWVCIVCSTHHGQFPPALMHFSTGN